MYFTPSQKQSIQDFIEREIVLLTEDGDPRVLSELAMVVLEGIPDDEEGNTTTAASRKDTSYGRNKVLEELSPFISRSADLEHFISGLFRYIHNTVGGGTSSSSSSNRQTTSSSSETSSSASTTNSSRIHDYNRDSDHYRHNDDKDTLPTDTSPSSKTDISSSTTSGYVHHTGSRTRSRSRSRERSYNNNNHNNNNNYNSNRDNQELSRDRYIHHPSDRYPRNERDSHRTGYPGRDIPPPPYSVGASTYGQTGGGNNNNNRPPSHGWQPPPYPGPGRPPLNGPPPGYHPHHPSHMPPYPPPPAYLHPPRPGGPPPPPPSSSSANGTTNALSAWGSAGMTSTDSTSSNDYGVNDGPKPYNNVSTNSSSSTTAGTLTKALRTIRVNNLHGENATIVSLSSYFSKYGQVVNVILTEHNQAYVQFKEPHSAEMVLHSREPVYGDRRIQVSMAKYDPPSSSGTTNSGKTNSHSGTTNGNKHEYSSHSSNHTHQETSVSSTYHQRQTYPSHSTTGSTGGNNTSSNNSNNRSVPKATEVIEPVVPIVVETAVDKAQRVLEEKLKMKVVIQEAIKEQKNQIEKLKLERSKLTPDEMQERKQAIIKESARIKEQQEKLETAIRIAKIAVDNHASKMAERVVVSNESTVTEIRTDSLVSTTNLNNPSNNDPLPMETGKNASSSYIPDEEIVIEGNDDEDNV